MNQPVLEIDLMPYHSDLESTQGKHQFKNRNNEKQ